MSNTYIQICQKYNFTLNNFEKQSWRYILQIFVFIILQNGVVNFLRLKKWIFNITVQERKQVPFPSSEIY